MAQRHWKTSLWHETIPVGIFFSQGKKKWAYNKVLKVVRKPEINLSYYRKAKPK
jgi:hypothetical protein